MAAAATLTFGEFAVLNDTVLPSLILASIHFLYDSRVFCQILNIPTKFGEDWSNSKEMAAHFRNSRWRRPPSLILVNMYF